MILVAIMAAVIGAMGDPGAARGFLEDTITHCTPVVEVGAFVGCTDLRPWPEDDAPYAGLVWVEGVITPQTGP